MSTPIVAGTAALVRQYFADGYYSVAAGAAAAPPALAAGFSPSAALMKAVLVNSASEMLYADYCKLAGWGPGTAWGCGALYPRSQIMAQGGHASTRNKQHPPGTLTHQTHA
jgi:hypothetical protein